MMAGNFDPLAVAYAAKPDAQGVYLGSDSCSIAWVTDDPDHLVLDVVADGDAFVVVADTHFPGWTATVDDEAAPIHRVNQLARGVVVPSGSHRIEMRFTPEGWADGVSISRLAALIWILLAGVWGTSLLALRRQKVSH